MALPFPVHSGSRDHLQTHVGHLAALPLRTPSPNHRTNSAGGPGASITAACRVAEVTIWLKVGVVGEVFEHSVAVGRDLAFHHELGEARLDAPDLWAGLDAAHPHDVLPVDRRGKPGSPFCADASQAAVELVELAWFRVRPRAQ